MKVILLTNVKKLGNKDDIVDVTPGFARNFLIPEGKAQLATLGTLKTLKNKIGSKEERVKRLESQAQDIAEQIKKTPVEFKKKASKGGKLYGSITAKQVAKALKEKLGRSVDAEGLKLKEPIRSTGNFTLSYQITKDVEAKVKVVVKSA